MKKIIETICLSALVLGCVSSCNFLEVPLESSVSTSNFYKTTDDFDMSLTGVYNTLLIANDADGMDIRYGTYFTGFLFLGRVGTDEMYAAYGSNGETDLSNYTFTANNKFLSRTWRAMYLGIQRANVIINRLEPMTELDGSEKDRILGETYFLRAFFYFHLVRLFENVPIVIEEVSDPSKIDARTKPASEVYAQIIQDLEKAEQMLPDDNTGGRPAKLAASAMLGKVYLQMAGEPLRNSEAASLAKAKLLKVIDSGKYSLVDDFFQQFDGKHEHGPEYIWDIEFTNDGTTLYGGQVGTIEGTTTDGDNLYWTQIRSTREFYETFDENDLRRECVARYILVHDENGNLVPFHYVPDGSTGTDWYYFAYKFRHGLTKEERGAGWANWANPINFPILRYADVLLMYAEAELRADGSVSAKGKEAFNQVRRRGYGKTGAGITAPTPSIDATSVTLESLLSERSHELAFEGHRWYDLVRFGKLVEVVQSVSQYAYTISVTQMASHVSEKNTIFPIPQDAIDASNGIMIQHEKWR